MLAVGLPVEHAARGMKIAKHRPGTTPASGNGTGGQTDLLLGSHGLPQPNHQGDVDMQDDASSADGRATALAFADRFAQSDTFRELFREGMGLVEETAAYLDGPGRSESRTLERGAALAYTTESMRLTTRLMQMASWLLLQRAVNEGELSSEQASSEKRKVRLDGPLAAVGGPTFNDLPPALQSLIERANRLQERLRHADGLLYGARRTEPTANPLSGALGRIADAFGARSEDQT